MSNEESIYWKNRGDEYVNQGRFEDAVRCYEKATNLNPEYISAWNNCGYSLSKLGKKDDAKKIKIKINELKEKGKATQEIEIERTAEIDSIKFRSDRSESPTVENKIHIKQEPALHQPPIEQEIHRSGITDSVSVENEIVVEQDPSLKQIPIEESIHNKSIKSLAKKSRDFFDSIGGAVKSGTRKIAYSTLLRSHKIHIKKLIIAEFDLKELKKMCLYFNIGHPTVTRLNSRNQLVYVTPRYDDWAKYALKHIELAKLKDYAKMNHKLTHKITELERKYKQDRVGKYPEYEDNDGTISYGSSTEEKFLRQELTNVIGEYRPIKSFKNELLYHTNLYTYLCEKIPGDIGFEVQRGSSRPDIVVGDVAIEIKGPTDSQGLITIADKINRYSQHFEHIIVVLFEVEVFERFYQEWYEGIMRQYEDQVTIIRK